MNKQSLIEDTIKTKPFNNVKQIIPPPPPPPPIRLIFEGSLRKTKREEVRRMLKWKKEIEEWNKKYKK